MSVEIFSLFGLQGPRLSSSLVDSSLSPWPLNVGVPYFSVLEFLLFIFYPHLRIYLLILEREEMREKHWHHRETPVSCLSYMGIEPATVLLFVWCTVWHCDQLNYLARAALHFYLHYLLGMGIIQSHVLEYQPCTDIPKHMFPVLNSPLHSRFIYPFTSWYLFLDIS